MSHNARSQPLADRYDIVSDLGRGGMEHEPKRPAFAPPDTDSTR